MVKLSFPARRRLLIEQYEDHGKKSQLFKWIWKQLLRMVSVTTNKTTLFDMPISFKLNFKQI